MKKPILTIEHPFHVRSQTDALCAAGGAPVHDSLDAATDMLEAVVAGLRDLMSEPSVSNQATLIFYAADSALALVYASNAGIEAAMAKGGAA